MRFHAANVLPHSGDVKILVLGQTPPPYHGQSLTNQRLLHGKFAQTRLYHVRMAFSSSIRSAGRFGWKKVLHLFSVIARALFVRFRYGVDILYFPASAHSRMTVLRDVVLLSVLRRFFSKTIFHSHGGISEYLESQPRILRRLAMMAYGHPDGAIELSRLNPPDAAYFHARRAAIIPNGLEDAALPYLMCDKRRADGRVHILNAGILSETKGTMVLLEAVRRLVPQHPNVALWCIGEFDCDEIERRAKRFCEVNGLGGTVSFLGTKVDQDKWEYFHRGDIFCFPSFYECETFGNVLVEAMMFQLPVVATRWRGIPDVVDDGVTGYLVPVKDAQAVADALDVLIRDPALRCAMGANGRRKYLQQFSLKLHLARIEDFFHEVARSCGDSRALADDGPAAPLVAQDTARLIGGDAGAHRG